MGYKEKSKTKRGRKQDRKLISLTTIHERKYLRAKTVKLLELIKIDTDFSKIEGTRQSVTFFDKNGNAVDFRMSTLKRIAEGLLKLL